MGRQTTMDPELPKGQQYRQIFPDRGLTVTCVPGSRKSSLGEIKREAEVARREEELKEKVERAKWRSVEQGCNYDQYRQLCLGADLKGLPAGAITEIAKEEIAPINRRTRRRGKAAASTAPPKPAELPKEAPADRDEFERHWRNVSTAEPVQQFEYLSRITPALALKLFKKGIEEHLGCILLALQRGWSPDKEEGCDAVAAWLVVLPTTFRFELAVGFLGEGEKAAARELFERVLAVQQSGDIDATAALDSVIAAKEHFQL